MERPIHILFAAPRDRYGDLVLRLQSRYAVHQARDAAGVIAFADQARAAGRPYDLAILAYDPPALGVSPPAEQLRVIAPTTPLITIAPPHIPPPLGPLAEGSHHLVEPVDTATALGLVTAVLEERAAHLARLRSAVVAPLAGLSDEVLRQPDLVGALRALYQQLAGLIRADYFYVALYDRRRSRVLVPLTWDRGSYRSGAPRRHQAQAGLSDWVLAHDTPLVSGNLPTDAARRGWPLAEPGTPEVPTSVMVLPLRLGGQAIGVLGVFQWRPGAFTQEDYQVVSFVTDFMAGVIGHWWGQRQWEHEHQVLQALARHLGTAPDRTAVLTQTAEAALQLTGMAAATLIGFDPAGALAEQVVLPAGTAFAAFTPVLAQLAQDLRQADGGMVDYAATTRTLADLGQQGVGRVVSYALRNDGRIDALLWLLHGSERPFDDQDQAALAAVAHHGQLALAEQTRQAMRTREQQVFARLAWRASVESSPALLLSTAFTEIGKLVPWQAAAVWQAAPALGVLHPLRIEGPLSILPAGPLPLQESPLAVALEQGGVQRLTSAPLDTPHARPAGPALAVSLQRSQAQAGGVLVLERAPGAPDFSLCEEAYLLNLAQLLVAGLERLRWQRLGALHTALAEALDHPAPAAWSHVVEVVAAHLGSDAAAALVLDGLDLRPLAVFAPSDAEAVTPWTIASPLLRAALQPGATPQVYSGPEIAPLGSLIVAPLVAGMTVLGALVAWSARAGAFGIPAIDVLTQAAAQVALAADFSRRQEQQARDLLARDLLAALPDLIGETDEARLYQRLVVQARETLGADLVVLFPAGVSAPAVPPQSGNQGPGAGAGSRGVWALVRQVLDTVPRHPDPYFVAQVTAQSGGSAAAWLEAEGICTMAFAPLLANGVAVGVLFAGWRHPLPIDAARRQAMSLVALLAASVLGATRAQLRLTTALQDRMQSLSMAAHELRDPLDKARMIIETALNGLWLPMSDELRKRLSAAYTLLDNHYELLNRVMQLDQLRTGQQPLARVPVALPLLLQGVVSRYADVARRADLQLQVRVDPPLISQHALLDPVLLSLALGNLVQNGIKFTPAGGQVAIGCTLSYAHGRELVFTVEDTGRGIPGDQATAIFAPYYQADRRQGRVARGLGLGLPIARLVAELHGGTLTVESRLDQGSRFTLRLPFHPAERAIDSTGNTIYTEAIP